MVHININDKDILYRFFDIGNGYILDKLYYATNKNKTWTQKIILESTGIDIFEDKEYRLSQQKAIEKIIDTESNYAVSKMLITFYDYVMHNRDRYINIYGYDEDSFDEMADEVFDIINKINDTKETTKLPSLEDKSLTQFEQDLKSLLSRQEYTLAVDRLHTYSLFFLDKLCKKHNIIPKKDPKGHIMFDDMVTQLQNKFDKNNLLNNFDAESLKNSKIIFQKYNEVRNNESFAHPNKILNNARAYYVVSTIINILNYIKEISDQLEFINKYCCCENSSGMVNKEEGFISWKECKDCHKMIYGTFIDNTLPF